MGDAAMAGLIIFILGTAAAVSSSMPASNRAFISLSVAQVIFPLQKYVLSKGLDYRQSFID